MENAQELTEDYAFALQAAADLITQADHAAVKLAELAGASNV